MDLKEIQNLIKFVANSGVAEVKLEMDDVKITIRTTLEGNVSEATYVQMPVQPALQQAVVPQQISPVPPVAAPAPVAENTNYITIKSPMIGTFYRSSGPDKPVFVNVGDEVAPGKVTCIIEAMKLFNEIECDVKGRIVKVLVDDATPVEYDQPLFLVEPA
jgi:acetyl-CoA carboxylase biotin carboxyl carrier protein